MLIGQLSEAGQVGTELVRSASQYDAATFVLIILIGAIVLIAVLTIWYIVIPDRKSQRESQMLLSQAVATSSSVIAKTHEVLLETHTKVKETQADVQKLKRVALVILEAVHKISDKSSVDLDAELGQVKGILGE